MRLSLFVFPDFIRSATAPLVLSLASRRTPYKVLFVIRPSHVPANRATPVHLIDLDQLRDRIQQCGWTIPTNWRLDDAPAAWVFSGSYSLTGNVAADVAEGILTLFTDHRLASGYVCIWYIEDASLDVLRFLIGDADAKQYELGCAGLLFEKEYLRLKAVLAWCLVSEWKFDFVSGGFDFIVHGRGADNLSVRYRRSEDCGLRTQEVLNAWGFARRDG